MMELLLLLLLYEGFGYSDNNSCTSERKDDYSDRRVAFSDMSTKHFNDPFDTMAMPPAWTKADSSDSDCGCTEE